MRDFSASKTSEPATSTGGGATRAAETPSNQIFDLQRTAGNQAVTRLLSPRLQPQLRVGPSDDVYEREADRMADQVMRMPAPAVQRKCAKCEEEDRGATVRADRTVAPSGGGASDAPPIVSEVVAGAGRPLDTEARAFMEPRFGRDFSRVQVHSGPRAAESARAINAVAYTVGHNVVFDEGAYQPGTDAGRRLLAHELTHVVQQGSAADTSILPDSEGEFGDSGALPADRSVQRYTASEPRVQRQESCCCCVTSAKIKNISRIDNSVHMGHSYDFEIKMAGSTAHGPLADTDCTLEWWERTNVPYTTGMAANTWTNMFALVPGSPTFDPWKNRSTACDSTTTVTINDPPALGKRAGRNVVRTLEFDLKVKSGTSCGCGSAEKSATATQVLTMVNGAPDWAASSFTTP